MSLTHASTTRNALADKIDDLINTGAGTAKMRCRDGSTTIVDVPLDNPAFGAASGGTITLAGVPLSADAVATGDLDNFQILDRNGSVVYSGTITATGGGGDSTVNNISVNTGQEVAITSLTYTAPV
jgi:hypothetical protein